MSLVQSLKDTLVERKKKGRLRQLTLPEYSVDFCSNDYLSLSTSPLFRDSFLERINAIPPDLPIASGGSRLLSGNSEAAESVERFLAGFHDAQAALLFNSGYDANVGVLSCIPQPGDIILYDELIHASLHEGMRLSRAEIKIALDHSCPESLKQRLIEHKETSRNIFVVVESVYSMDGDIAPLDQLVKTVEESGLQNVYFIVDEAHATGVLGPKGAGLVQMMDLQSRMFIRVHTFGKALASHGAVVLCCNTTRHYLINYAKTLIYTTAIGIPFLCSIGTAYRLLETGQTDKMQSHLQSLIQHMHAKLLPLSNTKLQVDHHPTSPIFSLRTPMPKHLAETCLWHGYGVRAIMSPTVPVGKERVRVCLHAGNTFEEVDGLVGIIEKWLLNSKL
ncbi:hypothetical protein ASPZODRAFT_75957 [Penicilliopsis zonata CBS 506.65]|uniref:Aminotransferase class I/classII large domain-containing protein n=1 Tax=Penicilliopsis zonata CBS 506.65 TaxID=1073090 RepID=A0A1L9S6J8_9EURO|nr:hypothetical protein ASPZODRAFT_75957 [Penicilliopsis zonata CBS 506.65]OJJ42791.1 hypothetical protein ASPZODRAFT_75957 [Penicilliopsis zonata CBS 506.65]